MSSTPFAVVTGANRGIGWEVAQVLAQNGFVVVAVCRRAEDAEETALKLETLSQNGGHIPIQMNAADPPSIEAAAETIRGLQQPLQALVNNAAVYPDSWDQATWAEAFTVNYAAPVKFLQNLLPLLERGASVVNVSSGYGQLSRLSTDYRKQVEGAATLEDLEQIEFDAGSPMQREYVAPYKVTKAMLNNATRILAQSHPSLRINAADPGWCRTRMGGSGAGRSAQQGARSVLQVLFGKGQSRSQTGGFFYDGKVEAW